MRGPLAVEAIVLTTYRYGESSKIARLSTRDHGVQSAIAKGALRPRSRFGASLQPLSMGQGLLLPSRSSDLHLLTAFELTYLPAGLARVLERYAAGLALAEVVLRFAPAAPHPETHDLLDSALRELADAPRPVAGALGLRWLWRLIGELGFAPALGSCVVDGKPVPGEGRLAFSPRHGGVLCPACARSNEVTWLPVEGRAALVALLAAEAELPRLDRRHEAAHRRLLARYLRHQLDAEAPLPAVDFWVRQPWEPT